MCFVLCFLFHHPSANMSAATIYTKEYPQGDSLDSMQLPELQKLAKQLEDDISLIEEENRMFSVYLRAQKEKDATIRTGDEDEDEVQAVAETKGRRTGKPHAYKANRRGSDHKEVFLSIDDKQTVTQAEQDRLKQEREKGEKVVEDARDLVRATIEEAQNRSKEVKMELAYFKREVAADREVSAEKILKYFADRPVQKELFIRRMKDKIATLQQSINKAKTQLQQREDVGEAFHTIDFDQLKIENQQFNERIEQKNEELVELKGTTTRTVQALNSLTDKLNALIAEQQRLRSTLKQKQDHVTKLTKEIETVGKESGVAQTKNIALKLQNEAVKVPKVEDYIAQKAECYELEKAALNWQRKVEIASGHVAVMKQQMLSLRKQLDPNFGGSITKKSKMSSGAAIAISRR